MSDPDQRDDEGIGDEARDSRQTGGDAPAAGSIHEREAIAEGEGPFSDEDEQEADDIDADPDAGREEAARSGRAGDRASDDDPRRAHEAARPPTEPPA